LLEDAIRNGVFGMRPELENLYRLAEKNATAEEKLYLPIIEKRIEQGSLAELMVEKFKEKGELLPILSDMEWCLRENRPYSTDLWKCG
jgi:hypothetical protein